MPSRNNGFRIFLGLDIAQLRKGMTQAQLAVSNFGKTLTRDGAARLQQFSRNADRLGRSLRSSVTLPIVAAGTAAAKFALDYETGLTKVSTLTGLARSEVDKLGESLLQVSSRSSVGVDQLTSALLVAVSAGFRGQEALEITESAARLASIGFGELDTITRALTVTVENYGAAGVNASRASDILLATAQQGNFDVTQLADVFGRLLATANALDVPINSVAANFAALTRATGSATESQTQLSAILLAFLKPAAQATRALDEIGFSVAEVREQLAEDGLYPVLKRITEGLLAAGIDLSKVFGRAQALAGVAALTNEASTVPQVLNEISNSVGEVNDQYLIWSETSEGKLKLALADTRNSAISLGQTVLPALAGVLSEVSDGVSGAATAFTDLTPATQKAVLSITAIAAGAPLALTALASLAKGVLALRKSFILASVAQTGFVAALASPLGLTIAAGAAVVGIGAFINTLDDSEPTFVKTIGIVEQLTEAFLANSKAANSVTGNLQNLLQLTPADRAGLEAIQSREEILRQQIDAQRQQSGRGDLFNARTFRGVEQLRELALSEADAERAVGSFQTLIDDLVSRPEDNPELLRQRDLDLTNFSFFADFARIFTDEGRLLRDLPAFESILSSLRNNISSAETQADLDEARQVAQEQVESIFEIYRGDTINISETESQIRNVLPALFAELNNVGDASLRAIVAQAELTQRYDLAVPKILALADTHRVQFEIIEATNNVTKQNIDLLDDQSEASVSATNALNAQTQATNRIVTAQKSLRSVLGLDTQILQGEEALQALFLSQQEAAILTLGNELNIDPESGLLDEYNQATIDALQAWFADIDRYAQSLGRGGEFAGVEALIAEQLANLTALEGALPDATYRRLIDRLDAIRRSALAPDAQVGGTTIVEQAAEQGALAGQAFQKNFAANHDLNNIPIMIDQASLRLANSTIAEFFAGKELPIFFALNPVFNQLTLREAEETLRQWVTYGAADAGTLGLDVEVDVASIIADVNNVIEVLNQRRHEILLGIDKEYFERNLASLIDSGTLNSLVTNISSGTNNSGTNISSGTNNVGSNNSFTDPEGLGTGNNGGSGRSERVAEYRARILAEANAVAAEAERLRNQAASGRETNSQRIARERRENELRRISADRDRRARLLDNNPSALGLAMGGIVTRPVLSLIGEGREPEAVVPLSRAAEFGFNRSNSNVTINVNGNFYGDEESFRDLVIDELRTHTRLNGVGSVRT